MENGPFIDDFPIKTSIYEGFSMAMLNYQRVLVYQHLSEIFTHPKSVPKSKRVPVTGRCASLPERYPECGGCTAGGDERIGWECGTTGWEE